MCYIAPYIKLEIKPFTFVQGDQVMSYVPRITMTNGKINSNCLCQSPRILRSFIQASRHQEHNWY